MFLDFQFDYFMVREYILYDFNSFMFLSFALLLKIRSISVNFHVDLSEMCIL